MNKNLVRGVGINDSCTPVTIGRKNIPSYNSWCNMLRRCYCSTSNNDPTYAGCTVCEEWKYFSNFKTWYDTNYIEGFHLDKDILVENNKVYSPDTCRYIPQYLNSLLTDSCKARGKLPVGVSESKPNTSSGKINSTYQVHCQNGHKNRLTKTFKSVEEASAWYSETKKRIVKEQAQRAFLANEIKTDIYLALIRRSF